MSYCLMLILKSLTGCYSDFFCRDIPKVVFAIHTTASLFFYHSVHHFRSGFGHVFECIDSVIREIPSCTVNVIFIGKCAMFRAISGRVGGKSPNISVVSWVSIIPASPFRHRMRPDRSIHDTVGIGDGRLQPPVEKRIESGVGGHVHGFTVRIAGPP